MERAFSLVAKRLQTLRPSLKPHQPRPKPASPAAPPARQSPSAQSSPPQPGKPEKPPEKVYEIEEIPEEVDRTPCFPVPDDRALAVPQDDGGPLGQTGWKTVGKIYGYITRLSRLDWGLTSSVNAFREKRVAATQSGLQDTYHGARV